MHLYFREILIADLDKLTYLIAWSLKCIFHISNTKLNKLKLTILPKHPFACFYLYVTWSERRGIPSPRAPSPIRLILLKYRHVIWAWLRCRVLQWSMVTDWQHLRLTHYPSLGTGNEIKRENIHYTDVEKQHRCCHSSVSIFSYV